VVASTTLLQNSNLFLHVVQLPLHPLANRGSDHRDDELKRRGNHWCPDSRFWLSFQGAQPRAFVRQFPDSTGSKRVTLLLRLVLVRAFRRASRVWLTESRVRCRSENGIRKDKEHEKASAMSCRAQPKVPKSPSPDEPSGQEFYARGLVRDIRVHSQDAQHSVAHIKSALSLLDRGAHLDEELTDVLKRSHATFERNKAHICDLLTRIEAVFNERRDLYNDFGDEVCQVADLWERVIQNWPAKQDKVDTLARRLAEIKNWLREIIWHCGFVTIPPRVNEHLNGLRPGQALDFHKTFIDELPDKKDRDEILKYLKDHPLYIEGITDAEHGVIYRADHNPRVRMGSVLRIVMLILAGFPLVWIACHSGDWLSLTGWPVRPVQFRSFLVAYVFVLLGSFLHVVIAAFKQARSGTDQPFTALEDFVLWIHVKEFPIMGGIVSVWFGLFGMVFLGKLPEWQTALFVGYGIDSVVDVLLKRFEAAVPNQASAL